MKQSKFIFMAEHIFEFIAKKIPPWNSWGGMKLISLVYTYLVTVTVRE